jgi:hypothetical protein
VISSHLQPLYLFWGYNIDAFVYIIMHDHFKRIKKGLQGSLRKLFIKFFISFLKNMYLTTRKCASLVYEHSNVILFFVPLFFRVLVVCASINIRFMDV